MKNILMTYEDIKHNHIYQLSILEFTKVERGVEPL